MSKTEEIKVLINNYNWEIIDIVMNYSPSDVSHYIEYLHNELKSKNDIIKDDTYTIAKYEARYGKLIKIES